MHFETRLRKKNSLIFWTKQKEANNFFREEINFNQIDEIFVK